MLRKVFTLVASTTILGFPILTLTPDQALSREYKFFMVNLTSSTLTELYLSPNTSSEWGINRLPQRREIKPGEEFEFNFNDNTNTSVNSQPGDPNCLYDIRGVFQNPDKPDEVSLGVDLCQVEQDGAYIFANVRSTLEIINSTDSRLQSLLIAPGTETPNIVTDSTELLGGLIIEPHTSIQIFTDTSSGAECDYTIEAQLEGVEDPLRQQVNLCDERQIVISVDNSAYEFEAPNNDDLVELQIQNNTLQVLHELYIAPAESSDGLDLGFNLLYTPLVSGGDPTSISSFFPQFTSTCSNYIIRAVFLAPDKANAGVDPLYQEEVQACTATANQPIPDAIPFQQEINICDLRQLEFLGNGRFRLEQRESTQSSQ